MVCEQHDTKYVSITGELPLSLGRECRSENLSESRMSASVDGDGGRPTQQAGEGFAFVRACARRISTKSSANCIQISSVDYVLSGNGSDTALAYLHTHIYEYLSLARREEYTILIDMGSFQYGL